MTAIRTAREHRVERARALRRTLFDDRVLRLVAIAAAVWIVGFATATALTGSSTLAGRIVGDWVYLLPELPLPILVFLAARHRQGRQRMFWLLLGGYVAVTVEAEAISVSYEFFQQDVPRVADALYLAGYAFAAPAIFLGFGVSPLRVLRSLLDASVVALALVAGGWDLLIRPLSQGHHLTAQLAIDLSYPALDVAIVMLLLTAALAAEEVVTPSVMLIATSFLAASVTDALYTYVVTIHGSVGAGSMLNVGWQLEFMLLGLGALVALRHSEEERAPRVTGEHDIGLALLLLAVVAVVAVAGDELHAGRQGEAIGLTLAVVAALVVRLLLAGHFKGQLAKNLQRALREQERLAISDPLTGLHNRRFFDDALELELARSRRRESSMGLLVLDLDHFKWINDRYGHQAGDDVLVETARRLEPVLRGGDLVARYGGEEFVVLLPETAPIRLREIAERCRRAVSALPFGTEGGLQLSVTVSVGGACHPEHASTLDELMGIADKALYRAKALGRDQVQVGLEHELELEVHSSSAHEFLQRLGDEIDREQGRSELSRTIAGWAELVAREMGLDTPAQRRVAVAARFHDIGKIAIPTSILRKRAQLSDAEWELVRKHPEHGARLVALVPEFRDVAPLIRDHHERPDGSGYPDGKGGEISLEAFIISVCDAWAAMRTPRAYRPPHSREYARSELVRCRGTQFDPSVVDAFLLIEERVGSPETGQLLGLPVREFQQT
jgi:diguanylate cyclase (GGDEF)-like protein